MTGCVGTTQVATPSSQPETQALKQASQTDFATLKNRVIPDFVASAKALANKKGMTLESLAAKYLETLTAEGAWPDVNYQQVEKPGWSPKDHLNRLIILAAAYNEAPGEELGTAISNALIYWLDADPQSWNWWWHDIGIPKRIGYSAVMAKSALSESLRDRVANYLPDRPNYSPTNPNSPIPKAANRTDIALAVLNRGLLTNDTDMVGKAIADIEATINVSTGEGIQHDYAFHQHGPQLYTSGYGPVWFNAAAKWADLVNDLPWAFAPEKMDILVSYLLDGQRWSKRHGQWDYNTMSSGSTFLMQRGNEYYNIFPVWDWALVPGVTAPDYEGKGADWGRIMQPDVSFVGGVSNQRYGVSAMELDIAINHAEGAHSTQPGFYQCGEGKGRTEAKKAWFSFADEVVALGAGINSSNCETVNTALNQTLLNGDVTVDGTVVATGSQELTDAKWVHHDGVGYVFPDSWKGTVANQTQTGSWKSIRRASSDELVSKEVFTLSMTHGANPANATYQYVIAPGKTADEVASYSQALPVEVLKNTAEVQAVRHNGLNVTGIVFYQGGSIQLNSDVQVKVNQPSIVLLDESGNQPTISVSTPGVEYSDLTLDLQSASYGNVNHHVLTPGGEAELGKSVTFDWDKGPDNSEREAARKAQEQAEQAAAQQPQLTLLAVADTELQGGRYADNNFDIVSRWDLWAGQISDKEAAEEGVTKEVKSVVKFDLTKLKTQAEKAVLKLHVRNVGGAPQTVNVAALTDSNWGEREITWNSLPAVKSAGVPLMVSEEQKKQWVELDVTALVNDARHTGAISLLLENSGSGFVAFGSDETDQIPELDIKRAL
jgi:hypothetical protein